MSRLTSLFEPRGIAVIGASRDPRKLGAVMLRSLSTFAGPVAGVNPRDADPEAGRYPSVAAARDALGEPLDLAVLCVPAPACAAAISAAARGGARAALVCSGGFAEAGRHDLQHDLAVAAADAGVALLGPNTSGFLAPARQLRASFVPGAASIQPGPVAVVAASGGVNHALAYLLADAGMGVSVAVGMGNAVDVAAPDVLRYLADDPVTRVAALHVESVTDGPALTSAVRYLSEHKPVVALVVGRADVADMARSHTGALATSWRTTRAALRGAGAVLVDDERELVDAVTALSVIRLPRSSEPAVGVVSAQAGPALLHTDGLRQAGVAVPPLAAATRERLGALLPPLTYQANPVDTGRPGPGFGDVLAAVADDPGIDLVSVYALTEPDALDLPVAVAKAAGRPLIAGLGGPADQVGPHATALRAQGVPVLTSPRALTTAVTALVHDARRPAQPRPRRPLGITVPSGPLDEDQAKSVLDDLGIATLPRRVCGSRSQAHAALDELGQPVAVKLLDASITHKSDVGGVYLGIGSHGELDQALDALEAAGHHRFLVESMAPSGVELIVGASRDPVFGPVVLLGMGGVVAEALADVAVAVAPVAPAEASALAEQLAGRELLRGFRGGPHADMAALGTVLSRIGDLLAEYPDIQELEINPLRVTKDGLIALDAVLATRKEAPDGLTDR